ncbi:restriction endonuclease subunit S [Sulfobacillus sp. hq2]|uniref:restriction endonuclease subunit S n=1 Tax=Sulfobacillus TaxID=28033 RepID=UPI000CD15262|nr:restriction endonuclease subunit S [Sulfobacillus sp. hq2]POB09491.1 hypothetical protein CO251_14785 [Sulfobacillus sp. hq2]
MIELARLGEMITVTKGKKPRSIYGKGPHKSVPYILIDESQTLFTDDETVPICFPDDILMIVDGSGSGKVFKNRYGAVGSTLLRIRPISRNLLPEYLFYFLEYIQPELQMNRVGGAIPHVDKSWLIEKTIPLPPLPVQRRIAEILGSVDAVIDSLRSSLDTLVQLEGQIIEYLLSRGLEQSEHCTHPGVGRVPTRWSILPLRSILLKAQYGLSLPLMASDPGSGIPVLRMNNIRHGVLDISDVKFLSQTDVTPEYILDDGDVLFNRTNSLDLVGKSACYDANLILPLTFASYLIRLKPNSKVVVGHFLTLFLNSEKGQQQIRKIITPGVSQANISASNLMEILVPVPPILEQTKIIGFVNSIQQLKASYSAEKDKITSLKTTLLSKFLITQPAVQGVTHV